MVPSLKLFPVAINGHFRITTNILKPVWDLSCKSFWKMWFEFKSHWGTLGGFAFGCSSVQSGSYFAMKKLEILWSNLVFHCVLRVIRLYNGLFSSCSQVAVTGYKIFLFLLSPWYKFLCISEIQYFAHFYSQNWHFTLIPSGRVYLQQSSWHTVHKRV